jgi:hypothetical protein
MLDRRETVPEQGRCMPRLIRRFSRKRDPHLDPGGHAHVIVSVQEPRNMLDEVVQYENDQGTVGETLYSRETLEQSPRQKFSLGIGGESHAKPALITPALHEGPLQGKGSLSGCCTAPQPVVAGISRDKA